MQYYDDDGNELTPRMNNQIRKLAEQAGLLPQLLGPSVETRHMLKKERAVEKFAELIVQECLDVIFKEAKWYWDREEYDSENAISHAARRIKEHFGVSNRTI